MAVLRSVVKQKKSFVDFIGLFFAITVLFGVAIFALVLYNTYNDNIKDKLTTALVSSTPEDANANVTLILEQTSGGISKLNPLFPLLVIGVFGYVVVLVFVSRSHPALFFVGLIVLGVALILAATFTNVYDAIAATDNFSPTAEKFTIIDIMMGNLPMIIFILFIAMSIVLYAMRQGPPQGGAY